MVLLMQTKKTAPAVPSLFPKPLRFRASQWRLRDLRHRLADFYSLPSVPDFAGLLPGRDAGTNEFTNWNEYTPYSLFLSRFSLTTEFFKSLI